MAGSSSSIDVLVDDFYFSALFDNEEIFPISDEKYAEALTLQEALISATFSSSRTRNHETNKDCFSTSQIENLKGKSTKIETGQSSATSTQILAFCVICMDAKTTEEMFRNDNCSHSFCSECIGKYVSTKIKENILVVTCPEPKCGGVLEPQLCRFLVPKEVFERWQDALCESLVFGSNHRTFCGPFKECSAMMVVDGDEFVTISECPHCHKLFCAQCNVPWHQGSDCRAFQVLKRNVGSETEDNMVMELAEKKNWRRCPGCKFFVEKSSGCMHILCRCGNEFCYGCGSKWSSSHHCRHA